MEPEGILPFSQGPPSGVHREIDVCSQLPRTIEWAYDFRSVLILTILPPLVLPKEFSFGLLAKLMCEYLSKISVNM
jgi:hypothetical protein